MPKIKNIFVDRDGTLIEDKHYLSDPQQVVLLPSVADSLKQLQSHGINFFVVTNQSGIGRAYFKVEDFYACQDELARQLGLFEVELKDCEFCPHDPDDGCECRKPGLGMWKKLKETYGLNPEECAMIGDKKEDVLFGVKANFAFSCLVATGKGLEQVKRLGLEFKDKAYSFDSACLDENNSSKTKCLLAKSFVDFKDYILRKH